MIQSTHSSSVLTLVSSPTLKLIEADLVARGLKPSARALFLFLWRAKTQPQKLPMGLIFSARSLAAELHCTVRTIQRAIQALVTAGLLKVQARSRRDGGSTTNRYFPIWRPMAAGQPTASRAPLTTCPPEELTEDTEVPPITPETVFVWPEMSGAPTTNCQGGEGPQAEAGQALDGNFSDPIVLNQDFQKSDQLLPDGPLLTFPDDTALQLFLLAALSINPARLQRWIRQYGLIRIAQVSVWLLSAPKGTIRNAGGWMQQALAQHWEAPLWVRDARARRQHTAQGLIREQEMHAQESAEGEKIARQHAAEEAIWAEIAPRLSDLPALRAYAGQLAQAALRGTYRQVFKPGSLTERIYLVRAAQERPDLCAIVSNATA